MQAEIHVELREDTNLRKAKTYRAEGKVPAVFYIHGEENISCVTEEKALNKLLHTEATVIDVHFPGKKIRKCIIRDVQYDPVTDRVIHLDLMGIKLDEKIRMAIPIVLSGSAAGVKEGGILEHVLREVQVEGLPLDIPEHIEVDVSGLNIGQTIHLRDVDVEKVEYMTDKDQVVVHVQKAKVVEEVTEEEEEELEMGEEAEESEE